MLYDYMIPWFVRIRVLKILDKIAIYMQSPAMASKIVSKDLCNANACWLVLIYNTLIITNVAKRLFKYVPYILL